jgi:DNA processing protein
VVVVQAAEHSGALITARWAADQGRDVFAVPGPGGDPKCRGSNQLLRDGAILAESGWDILREYVYRYPGAVKAPEAAPRLKAPEAVHERQPGAKAPPAAGKDPSPAPQAEIDFSALSPIQKQIVEALQNGPVQLDTLIDRLGLPAAQLLPQLTLLQVKKRISQKPGKIYQL